LVKGGASRSGSSRRGRDGGLMGDTSAEGGGKGPSPCEGEECSYHELHCMKKFVLSVYLGGKYFTQG